MEKLMEAAKERGCFLELNAHPTGWTSPTSTARWPKRWGSRSPSPPTPTASPTSYYMRFGIGQARRGWLEKADVLNTRSLQELKKLIEKRKCTSKKDRHLAYGHKSSANGAV